MFSTQLHNFCLDLADEDDEVVWLDVGGDFHRNAFATLNQIRQCGQLCDVVLVAENQKFSAHRLVLAASVPFFHAMFTTDMSEMRQKEIEMKEFDGSTLEQIVNYAYTGRIRVCAINVQSIMLAAHYLRLVEIVDLCGDFLKTRLQPSNVLGIREFAATLGCAGLVQAADRELQKHFLSVVQSDEFLALPVGSLLGILCRDQLFVESEEDVFKAALRWLEHDPISRARYSSRVLVAVRLPLLKPQFITDHVASNPIIRSSLECRDLVDEAKDYHLIPERRNQLRTFRTIRRCCHDVPGQIFAVGGLTAMSSFGTPMSTVEMYDPLSAKWTQATPMTTYRSRVGVAVLHRDLYAIGGFDGHDRLRTVEVMRSDTHQWEEIAPLNNKRSALAAAALNGRLYVCGGYDGICSLASVEVFNASSGKWTLGISMGNPRSASGIAVVDDRLFVVGGHDGMSIFDSVECFNPENCEWSAVAKMKSRRCRLGATALDGKVYVCGGYDGRNVLSSAEVYNPATDTWTDIAPMNYCRGRVALVANSGLLYAIAGNNGETNLSSMEVYDPRTDSWTVEQCLTAHEGGVGVGVVPVSTKEI
uniref:BTB domain-containing protein n=1 Tax=Steinernema glaseri TaxID=37863 RepID=A0A1I7ZLE3_9BILA